MYESKELKRDDIVKYKILYKEPHYLCFSHDMVEMTKLRGHSHVGHVACEMEMRNVYKILDGEFS